MGKCLLLYQTEHQRGEFRTTAQQHKDPDWPFSRGVVPLWNQLSQHVAIDNKVDGLKQALDACWAAVYLELEQ